MRCYLHTPVQIERFIDEGERALKRDEPDIDRATSAYTIACDALLAHKIERKDYGMRMRSREIDILDGRLIELMSHIAVLIHPPPDPNPPPRQLNLQIPSHNPTP